MNPSDERFLYDRDDIEAADAVTEAQRIVFGPILFQAAVCLRDFGVLARLKRSGAQGAALDEIVRDCGLSVYAAGVLLDAGLAARLLFEKDGRFFLGRVGRCLLGNAMTRVNMDYVRDVCYAGMAKLGQALREGKPAGLGVFGDWPTIYPALPSLPEPARTSWFAFDHHYSDDAFGLALAHVFRHRPGHIYDVGGNTGRWALRCAAHDRDVRVTVLDLPEQLALLEREIGKEGPDVAARIGAHSVDMLRDERLPGEADVWWMSQFLDCFSEAQITGILARVRRAMKPEARLFILEPLCDRQRFEAGALTLNAISLYFTCMANGNSRFLRFETLEKCLARSGFVTEEVVDGLGIGGHTLMIAAPGE
ncbi:MAG: class I SAM-dependent methyltransferase [Candidatus Accumulibacter sp.]|jgi:ubiquinone/menaquinone biosynthesis C-methylase UbiE|nr:class I SAM-dependent methyltransferase [Accumulibacter sp.]